MALLQTTKDRLVIIRMTKGLKSGPSGTTTLCLLLHQATWPPSSASQSISSRLRETNPPVISFPCVHKPRGINSLILPKAIHRPELIVVSPPHHPSQTRRPPPTHIFRRHVIHEHKAPPLPPHHHQRKQLHRENPQSLHTSPPSSLQRQYITTTRQKYNTL